MKTYISILRGINVSGQKKIIMSDLKTLFESLKFNTVTTYIQSGNVIFKSDQNVTDTVIANQIEEAIYKKYKFTVPVIIRSGEEIRKVISLNPFLKEKNINLEKLHVTFLSEVPNEINLEKLKGIDYSPDRFTIIGKEIFLYIPEGYGNTKLSNNFFENKLKVTATTRNWKTVNKLFELASIN
jgi:uncharacterized protein (DUF1697 family)